MLDYIPKKTESNPNVSDESAWKVVIQYFAIIACIGFIFYMIGLICNI